MNSSGFNLGKTLPVKKWVVNLEHVEDESLAREGWLALIRAQGWSPVGEPEVVRQPMFGEYAVYGRVVKYPGIVVDAKVTNAIRVP